MVERVEPIIFCGFGLTNQNPLKLQSVIHLFTFIIIIIAFGEYLFLSFFWLWIIGGGGDREVLLFLILLFQQKHLVTDIHQQITIKNYCYEEAAQ